ncbi:MAG: hypothetical protein MUE47_03100, partial [Acidobacteria bacterium]|nr:hypothetical protein [Acidobacteriota bacterium]
MERRRDAAGDHVEGARVGETVRVGERRAERRVVEPVTGDVAEARHGRAEPVAGRGADPDHTGERTRIVGRGADLIGVDEPGREARGGVDDATRVDLRRRVVVRRADEHVGIRVDEGVPRAGHRAAEALTWLRSVELRAPRQLGVLLAAADIADLGDVALQPAAFREVRRAGVQTVVRVVAGRAE